MYKSLALTFLLGGVVLMTLGVTASQSFESDISRFVTGSPTDKAMWMLIGGVSSFLIGLAGMFSSTRELA